MSGKLTINRVENCSDLTINMDGARIIGDYRSLEVNDISNSQRTSISMKNMEVMTHDQYNAKLKGEPYHSRGAYGNTGPAGDLTVNRISDSSHTKIDQDNMKISGNFDSVTMNDVVRSRHTDITMKGVSVQNDQDSDSSSSDDDSLTHNPEDDEDEYRGDEKEYGKDGLPLPATYAYYKAPKITFNIKLAVGSNVTCTFLKKDKVKTVKDFILELQPQLKHKSFRLQEVDSNPVRYMDDDPKLTLLESGFHEKINLRVVTVNPTGDIHY